MLNLGTGELIVIFLVALVVLGPNKLPDAARQAGRMMAELRRLSSGFQDEMREAMREPLPSLPPLPPEAETPAIEATATPVDDASTPATRRRREPLQAHPEVSAEQQLSD